MRKSRQFRFRHAEYEAISSRKRAASIEFADLSA